jgi:hypothetical protein
VCFGFAVFVTQLKDITGKVKMVAVGYGREAEDGSQTLGGRSVDELSANITTISQELNTGLGFLGFCF